MGRRLSVVQMGAKMTPEHKEFKIQVGRLRAALLLNGQEGRIEALFQAVLTAHQAWWETTETWKAINEESRDQHEP